MRVDRVLIVDDDERLLARARHSCGKGVTVFTATSCEQAEALAREHRFVLALVDLRLGNELGIDVIATLKRVQPEITAVLISGLNSVPTTVAAMKAGASDVLEKPVSYRDVIRRLETGSDEPPPGPIEVRTADEVERDHLLRVYEDCAHNVSKTARLLGVSRFTVHRRLRDYGYKRPRR